MRILFLLLSLAFTSTSFAADCYQNMCVGDRVADVDSSYKEGIVVSLRNSTATIKSDSGEIWTESYHYLAILKPGCGQGGICVGDIVYDVDSGFKRAKVIGIRANNSYLYKADGLFGGEDQDTADYLAQAKPGLCAEDICVGDEVYDRDTVPHEATVVAIRTNTKAFVMRYSNGTYGSDTISYISLTTN